VAALTPPEYAFAGFPSGRVAATPVPNLWLTRVLPEITEEAELRVTLHVFWLIAQKRGFPRYTSVLELTADTTLDRSLARVGGSGDRLTGGLQQATDRGTLLRVDAEVAGRTETLYFVNDAEGRRAVAQLRAGQISIGQSIVLPAATPRPARLAIIELYEQNIGLVTPLLAEELAEAERVYPADWVEDAFRQAVSYGRRNWRYIRTILERWAVEGRTNEATGRGYGGKGPTAGGTRSIG
jgi:DNA replication protein